VALVGALVGEMFLTNDGRKRRWMRKVVLMSFRLKRERLAV
jgi:hypothetical protein